MPPGPLTTNWLQRLGYARDRIARYTGDTRLLQDIGLLGDSAEEDLTVLRDEYGVDFSTFSFCKYFPGELAGDALILHLFGYTRWGRKIKDKYPPVTLDMVEQTIANKRWGSD